MLKLISFVLLLTLLSTAANCQAVQDSVGIKKDTSKSAVDLSGVTFEKVEMEAQFPGGQSAWIKYLRSNLDPDVPVRRKAPVGHYQVIVKFIVSKTGKVTGIKAETNHGFGMEQELIRIIKNGPDWIPAMQNGRKVNAYRRQPVTFSVTNQ